MMGCQGHDEQEKGSVLILGGRMQEGEKETSKVFCRLHSVHEWGILKTVGKLSFESWLT